MVSFMPVEVKIAQYVVIARLIDTSNGFMRASLAQFSQFHGGGSLKKENFRKQIWDNTELNHYDAFASLRF
jgi:hypothetical protein